MRNRTPKPRRPRTDRSAFTLIELLAVMAIMLLLSALVVGGYFGMVRGSAAISARDHLYNSLTLARQRAMMNGTRTYLVVTDENEYAIVQAAGTISARDNQFLYDDYGDLENIEDSRVTLFNMRTGRRYENVLVEQNPPGRFRFTLPSNPPASHWRESNQTRFDRYGWQVGPTLSLPKGYRFERTDFPFYVAFEPGGHSLSGQTFSMIEEIAASRPLVIEVDQTGKIEVRRDVG